MIGIADDELEAAVQVFFVRKGRVVGRKGFVRRQGRRPQRRPSSSRKCSRASTTSRPAARRRRSRSSCPIEPDDLDLYEEWLTRAARLEGHASGCRSGATSGRCMETVTQNATEEFVRHKLRRSSDHNAGPAR